jgi:phosphohistidine phosphatase
MRHAKSSHHDATLVDHERPLNERGRNDAVRMGALLADKGLVPGRILSSDAVRARETAQAVAGAAGIEGPVLCISALYGGEASDYLAALAALPDRVESAIIVGHNPAVEALLEFLTGLVIPMPTSAVAQLRLPVDHWATVTGSGQASLVATWSPKGAS